MIIYKCRFSGDELCSDAFKPGPVTDADGNVVEGLMQIQSQKVNKVCMLLINTAFRSFLFPPLILYVSTNCRSSFCVCIHLYKYHFHKTIK